MKKRPLSWKKKTLLTIFSVSLLSSGIIVPVLNQQITSTVLTNGKLVTGEHDKPLLNNSEDLIKAVDLNSDPVDRLDNQISYFADNFNLEIQTNFFKDINADDVFNQVLSNSDSQIPLVKNKSFNLGTNHIQEHEQEFKNIITQIKNGKITPISILEKEKNFAVNNKDIYENAYNDVITNYDKKENFMEKSFPENQNLSNTFENYYIQNKSLIVKDAIQSAMIPNFVDVTIDKNEAKFVLDLENTRNRLNIYQDKVYGVAITAAVLTAVAWANAVYYWSAWWMFGANVPFAIAATIQAGVMTYSTNESWNNYYSVKEAKEQINQVLYSTEYIQVKDALNYLLYKYTGSQIMSDSTITFSIFTLGLNTTYPILIREIIKTAVTKLIKKITTKIVNSVGKRVLKNIVSKISTYASKMATQKILLKSIGWATWTGRAVVWLDNLLSVISFSIDMFYIKDL